MRPVALLAALTGAVLAGSALVLVAAPAALAHNVLRSSTPAAGAEVATPPEAVSLVFDQPAIALGNVVAVTAPDGSDVSVGEPELTDTTVRQPISATAAGEYRVVWRVTSSDGHPIEGELGFTVATAAQPSTSAAPSPTEEGPAEASPTEEASPSGSETSSGSASEPAPEAAPEVESDPAAGGSGTPWLLVIVGALVAGGGVWFLLRRNAQRGRPGSD